MRTVAQPNRVRYFVRQASHGATSHRAAAARIRQGDVDTALHPGSEKYVPSLRRRFTTGLPTVPLLWMLPPSVGLP